MRCKAFLWLGCMVGLLFAGCDDDEGGGKSSSCSVQQLSDGITVTCSDGSGGTVRAPGGPGPDQDGGVASSCTVSRTDQEVTIRCDDGSTVTFPVGEASSGDGGAANCTVTQDETGTITVSCPDGSTAVIPGDAVAGDGGTLLIGATRAACGSCHDSSSAKAHFRVMTTVVEGQLEETCGTCHNETSIEPVSRVHARLELGAPGFEVELLGASIDATTRKPTVQLSLTDAAGAPLTKDATMSFNFVISKVETANAVVDDAPIAGAYRSYISRTATQANNPDFPLEGTPRVVQQPTGERGTGTFTSTGAGLYDYTFTYALPVGYDSQATHVIAAYVTRTIDGVRFVSNATHFFVPGDESAEVLRRNNVRTETCNGCHNPLSAHGGSRQDVQLCLTCHSQGAVDPESNESIDFNVMVHKIHMGAHLPSVQAGGKYAIVGNGNNTLDFSHVEYPRDILHCQSCHTDSDDERWVDNGTVEACTSCHENIYELPADGEGGRHPFTLTGDPPSKCGNANCHGPGGNAADAREAHRTFLNLDTAAVLDVSIVSVTAESPDSAPVVRIRALSGTRATGGIVPLTSTDQLSTLTAFLNGPNSGFLLSGHDIKTYRKADLADLAADAANPGEFTFALPETLREAVSGLGDPSLDSYTLGLRAAFDPTPGASPDNDRVDMLRNPTQAFTAAEESPLVSRAAVVDTAKCNACHGDLRAHGGDNLARNVEECAMCHTASLDTSVRQGANKLAGRTTSLRLSTLIHRIHAGDYASDPYRAFGFAPAAPYPELDFSAREYPGNLQDCAKCHNAGTYFLPLAEGALPSITVTLDENGNVVGE
jgi:OmcA/MtrC family decaheme c-type cytochrome